MSKHLEIDRGEDAAWDIGPVMRGGTVVDLTGYTITFHAMRDNYTGEEVITKTLTSPSPESGTILLQLVEDDTPAETFGKSHPELLYWVIKLVSADGWTDKEKGTLTVKPSGP
jgi:hypothetical protein